MGSPSRTSRPPSRRTLVLLFALLAGCSTLEGLVANDDLPDGTWRLVELEGTPVLPGVPVTLSVEDERVFGSGGVNRYFATRASVDGELRIQGVAATRMAGPADATQQERRFLALLERVDGARHRGDRLDLMHDRSVILRFER